MSLAEKIAYVDVLLCGLATLRARAGIPHWTVIDEAHYFFHAESPCTRGFDPGTGGWAFVTYRPSLVARAVFDSLTDHLVTQTTIDDERYLVEALLRAHGPRGLDVAEALAGIVPPRAALFSEGPDGGRWRTFMPEARVTAHTHHARKYVESVVDAAYAFRFLQAGTPPPTARSIGEFHALVAVVPSASLAHHLAGGDFSRWAADVLGDAELAAGFAKLEQTARTLGVGPARGEILRTLESRYLLRDGNAVAMAAESTARAS
jgi:hypothetical protein